MKVQVRFFAKAKDIVGSEQATVELLSDGPGQSATIADLRTALVDEYAELKPMAASLLFAVGTDYVVDSVVLQPECQVVCFPPVSGG